MLIQLLRVPVAVRGAARTFPSRAHTEWRNKGYGRFRRERIPTRPARQRMSPYVPQCV